MWYYFHVNGRPQQGNSVALDRTGSSSCAKAEGALKYFERASGSERTVAPANGTAAGY